ncbi:RagB/SusD family nutrient uptake outer membrane protein [Pseudoflavitalea rhizosphaerae]|uniref:RagB/SusD family nutrient uptake outer membrane protein n=1 Tax=Pseudoflavitalea rhizosphaerae TaxID=1884793 RepID=UPI000F8F19BE
MINQFRQKGFKPLEYADLSAATPAEALNIVLDERRRELFCTSARFIDLKRINKKAALSKTIIHIFQVSYLYPGS